MAKEMPVVTAHRNSRFDCEVVDKRPLIVGIEEHTIYGSMPFDARVELLSRSQLSYIVNEYRTRANLLPWHLTSYGATPPFEVEAHTAQDDLVLCHFAIKRDGGRVFEERERDEALLTIVLVCYAEQWAEQDEAQELVEGDLWGDVVHPDGYGEWCARARGLQNAVHPIDGRLYTRFFLFL
jgi:hypothetical protein